jgi:hypothetical protein
MSFMEIQQFAANASRPVCRSELSIERIDSLPFHWRNNENTPVSLDIVMLVPHLSTDTSVSLISRSRECAFLTGTVVALQSRD